MFTYVPYTQKVLSSSPTVTWPTFVLGETTLSEWSYLRTAPAPWAELEFDNIILTVPTDVVKDLERPDELAEHWNIMMNAIADLAARPHKFKRKERVVTDVQISHGMCIYFNQSFAYHCINTFLLKHSQLGLYN